MPCISIGSLAREVKSLEGRGEVGRVSCIDELAFSALPLVESGCPTE